MARDTKIAWADATFNPWIGCVRISDACTNCYAAALSRRTGRRDPAGRDLWDPHATRLRTSPANWRQPLAWNAQAAAAGIRRRVFCASMADIFDNHAPASWRADLWALIRATPALDWLILTKRPQNAPCRQLGPTRGFVIADAVIGEAWPSVFTRAYSAGTDELPAAMLPADWGPGWPNVWLGATTENQTEASRRLPHLTAIPAAIRFLSVEPMLERIDLAPWLDRLAWVICGGESGRGKASRALRPAWARDLRDQVQKAGGAFFLKQLGSNRDLWPGVRQLHGADPSEWPADLQVQDFPAA